MTFGQSIEYGVTNRFFSNIMHAKNEARTLVKDPFFLFQKALYELKANGLHLCINILR